MDPDSDTGGPITCGSGGFGSGSALETVLSIECRVADPGSRAFSTPGSGIRNRCLPDPGSERPKNVWIRNTGKKFYISLKIGPNFSIQHSKLKYFNYEN
jgi:hypothetical protein